MTGLDIALTPVRFLQRSSEIMPDKVAIVDGERRWTYREFAAAVQQLAKALRASGITDGERVAYLAGNSAEMLIAHYAVPLARGVLVAINTRLSPNEIGYICRHSGARILFGDRELIRALHMGSPDLSAVDQWIELPAFDGTASDTAPAVSYEQFLGRGAGADLPWEIDDETRTISINYTSGTTGQPKGVMYSHRGAYLSALSGIHHSGFSQSTKYLWTLPMFHCNGWCATWAVTAAMGTHFCLRAVRGDTVWASIDEHQITHLSGAPTVLTILAHAEQSHPLTTPLTISNGGAPPSPTIIGVMRALGASIVHMYGLTETYGPYAVCEVQPEWDQYDDERQALLMARQGVGILAGDRVRVVRETLTSTGELVDVEADGAEMGEIVMRGNGVMKGYYNDAEGTRKAFVGGWFHSGDLGVMHPDGYVQLRDRAKDIVISGGENISTIEVEHAILSHPAVLEAAVVGTPDDKWGERPKAFVVVKNEKRVTATDVIAHVRSHIASYKAPSAVEFVDTLPKTSTGKVRKNELREAEWKEQATRIKG